MSFRILSIDGGGIRGVIPGKVLMQLEKEIKSQYGDNKNITDYFDLVAGTSTGGILAIGLCIPGLNGKQKFNAKELTDIYVERGDDIFDISVWKSIISARGLNDEKYDAEELEDALNDYFGDALLSDLTKPCLISSYDIKRRRAHFFRQTAAVKHDKDNFYAREVARATSAAPTYFETAKIKSMTNISYPLVDGGLFANNPTMCAYAEARNIHEISGSNDMTILSLGTGESKESYPYSEVKDWGATSWVKPVIDIMSTAVSETTNFHLEQIFSSSGRSEHYQRIQKTIPTWCSAEMDDASPGNIRALQEVGEELAAESQDRLKDFVALLGENSQ